MTKIFVCGTLYFRNHISYDLHLCYTCMYKRIISSSIFFIFFSKIWFLGSLRGGGKGGGVLKGQKMTQNDKKFCLSHSVSQEPYIILWFLVYMCKMLISSGVFFNFKNLIFQVVRKFYWSTSTVFLIYFSSSSINAKKKFWGVPHLFHMCVIFLCNLMIKSF